MDTVTYPDARVVAEVAEHFVPVKLQNRDNIDLLKKYNVRWLPGVVATDGQERVHHQWVGWLSPDEFRMEATFGRGQAAILQKRFDVACDLFERLAREWPDGERTPEAHYWWGVAEFRRGSGQASALPRWKSLVERYPKSQWARKVEIYLPT
jgi:TolA-binding protein